MFWLQEDKDFVSYSCPSWTSVLIIRHLLNNKNYKEEVKNLKNVAFICLFLLKCICFSCSFVFVNRKVFFYVYKWKKHLIDFDRKLIIVDEKSTSLALYGLFSLYSTNNMRQTKLSGNRRVTDFQIIHKMPLKGRNLCKMHRNFHI